MRYFIRIPDIAAAENDTTADRLIARGYKECPRAYYMAWWQLRDQARKAEMAREDAASVQNMSYIYRIRHR